MPENSEREFFLNDNKIRLIVKSVYRSKSFKVMVENGKVFLHKPFYAKLFDALEFLKSNERWVLDRLANSHESEKLSVYLAKNNTLFLNGVLKSVSLMNSRTEAFYVENENEMVFSFPFENEDSLQEIFIECAKKHIKNRVDYFSSLYEFAPHKISLRSQKSRWASRSASGVLSFNWRVLLLNEDLQNYVILHELAHSKFMDHSVSFWIFLNRICPNARKLDRALVREGKYIFSVGRE